MYLCMGGFVTAAVATLVWISFLMNALFKNRI